MIPRIYLLAALFCIISFIPGCEDNPAEPQKPKSTNSVMDIDGNVYHVVKIGNQKWLLENLKVTRYSNGDPIPHVTDENEWKNLTSGAYCNHGNNADSAVVYGHLYNWYAINDSRRIAPDGWHVPSDAEWQALIDSVGGPSVAGGKLKETGILHWNDPNEGATNASGFTALGGGMRSYYYGFSPLGNDGLYWSSTESGKTNAYVCWMAFNAEGIQRPTFGKRDGLSVRLIKDEQ